MSRPISRLILVLAATAACLTARCAAQHVEEYLSDRGLDDLLADHLVERLSSADESERTEIAQRLAALYVRLLDSASTDADREQWSERASNLLRMVPEADSPDLRINLGKAAYLRAEAVAERHRLRMATPEERAQAERVLRRVAESFIEIAQRAHQSARRLEQRLAERLEEDEEERVVADLAAARQQRSLGFYYAGWSAYYTALLSGDRSYANRALQHFGWLLNASEGEEASFDRLQPALLRYEHVARSAIGASLACSIQGRSIEAVAWLDAVERSTETNEAIRAQVLDRRIAVLAAASLWPDLDIVVRRARGPGEPLPPTTARLLVVSCLEALSGSAGRGRNRELIRRIADAGLEDLIVQGNVSHVLDVVRLFGTEPLGDSGFVVLYVRGLRALDRAKEADTAAGGTGEGPAEDDAVAALYREAGGMLLAAADEPDAHRHPRERVEAVTSAGTAYYLAGDASRAADVLERAVEAAEDPAHAEHALWLAVVALDEAVEAGVASLRPRRDQLAQLYLVTYPGAERAARLLMRPETSALVPTEEAAEILLGVPPGSPSYLVARRNAAQLLYRLYRQASPDQRTFAGERFAEVASDLVRREQEAIRNASPAEAQRIAQAVALRVRQIADAALGLSTPDTDRAEFALDTLDRVAAYADLDIDRLKPELAYRRLQIAAAKRDVAAMDRWYAALAEHDGGFVASAQRLLYREAVSLWLDRPADASAARSVVRYGLLIADQLEQGEQDPGVLRGVLHTIAQAAAAVWEISDDASMLEAAIETDARLIEVGGASGDVLRRHARLLETARRVPEALEAWRRLVSGLDAGTEPWTEARYESIRLLSQSDAARAKEALRQHVALYPTLGPSPWDRRFRELARTLDVEVSR